jgi:2,4-dienoyl-CoA reductase (NADPH2)
MRNQPIFEPLKFRNLEIKNRIMRSSISGRIDNYNGSGTPARVLFEEKFARGGVGAIISSHVPIRIDSRVLPNYATIDSDKRIPFWETVGKRVRSHDGCKYIIQLSMSGRQQDIRGIENRWECDPPSSVSGSDPYQGLPGREMSQQEIAQAIKDFATAAVRAKKAGLDGIELHSSNGYLFNQFLSSAINTRKDEYGGDIKGRARFLIEVLQAIRSAVGSNMFLCAKLSVTELNNAVSPWPLHLRQPEGNTREESVAVARMIEAAGADAIHVSTGSLFPHPRNPAGPFPFDMAWRTYQSLIASGSKTFYNYLLIRRKSGLARRAWRRTQKDFLDRKGNAIPSKIEGLNLDDAKLIRKAVKSPVICTGGFQTATGILKALDGSCDAVSIARPLLANPDLPRTLMKGHETAERPCSYCNKCLLNVLEHPLGCYDLDRYDGDYDRMIAKVMDIFPDKTGDSWMP